MRGVSQTCLERAPVTQARERERERERETCEGRKGNKQLRKLLYSMRFLTSSRTTVWSLYDSLLASETNNHSMIGPAPEHLLLRLLVVTSIHQSINRIELANIGRSMLRGSSIAPRASSNSRPDGGGDHGAVFDATSAVLSKLVAHFQAPNDASAAADAAANAAAAAANAAAARIAAMLA